MTENSPLHAQLYAEMVRRIHSGVWQPGDRVPSEKSLVAEFGTSRGPVRQALAALRTEGMIIGGRGAPPRVQRTAPPQSFDTFMSFTEWAGELGLEPGQRVIEASRRPATEEIARELQIAPDAPIVEIIRVRSLDAKPAMLERSLFPYEVGRQLLGADLDGGSIYQTLRHSGVVPVRARHVIDAIAAHPLEVEQLHIPVGSPLLRVRRQAFDEAGTVIETADDRYLPSMATFIVENNAEHRTPFARQAANATPSLYDPESRTPRPTRSPA
ncbi:GntR family transcriptional regulator [Leucobacter allii]|uniref:GntR family transcriptional regulator n=1 Tax=Leucobacter allii TaxID=2932247 RepID=A0ABY4FN34_9MICO|nr:GntR family transcriptional regulator [Leucobacter allii]UOQ57672.1 GntR family transcriptional regulator [Leucobacter allii]UOR02216.1 GntR family transcriptional regulator [Leucobacter allii]